MRRSTLHLGRVDDATLAELAADAADRKPTAGPGLLEPPVPRGFAREVWRRTTEHGDLARAADAIRAWRGHREVGIELHPSTPEIALGTTLALAIPTGPVSFTATCRVVEVVDTDDAFGFTYATLPHHPETGEESFTAVRAPDGSVEVVIEAVSQPTGWITGLVPPITRFFQRRIVERYLDGLTEGAPRPPRA